VKVRILVETTLPSGIDEDETDLEFLIEELESAASNVTGYVATAREIKK